MRLTLYICDRCGAKSESGDILTPVYNDYGADREVCDDCLSEYMAMLDEFFKVRGEDEMRGIRNSRVRGQAP